ncbi:MAG: hypothetical protein ICV60_10010 [Pyrinomonadaceae bacterium]|nr:hypothetical protein [Pyrinomonadaceae bacterium]
MSSPYCWTINSVGEVWTLNPGGGGQLMSPAGEDFAMSDIAMGPDGTAWAISTMAQKGGALIIGSDPGHYGTWHKIPPPAAADRLSVGPDGTIWTVNVFGEVWALNPGGGGYIASPPGVDFALDIGAGADGSVWIASTDTYTDGNVLKRWNPNNNSWTALPEPASATRVAINPKGILFTVNSKGEVWLIYPQGGGALLSPPGPPFAQDISVGADGSVWIISNQGRPGGDAVMLWSGANQIWNAVPKPAAAVAVAGAVK